MPPEWGCGRLAARLSGLACGLAPAVRPAGSAEVSGAQGRVPKIVSAKRLETIMGHCVALPWSTKTGFWPPAACAGLSWQGFFQLIRRRSIRWKTSDAVKLSSCLGKFFRGGGEGDGFVVLAAGGQAVVQAAEEAAEQVALGGGRYEALRPHPIEG